MIQLFEPIFIATEILSTSTYPTISDVRLTIIGLLRYLESFIQIYTNLDECMVAESIRFKLQEYWEHIDESTTIGTLLDPRSKTKTFMDINQRDKAVTLLRNKVELFKNDTNRWLTESTHNLRTRENKRSFFESLISEKNSEQIPVEDEIARYLALPVDPTTNPLDWWHHFSRDFPILASMASCYLSIQGSSVPSEQIFSMATNTITKIRCNLKPDTARSAMCLKSWIQQVRDKKEKEINIDEFYFLILNHNDHNDHNDNV